MPAADRDRLIAALDAEIRRRLPAPGRLLLDPDVLDVALPLSGRATAAGLGVLPRGSVSAVDGELLRFFVYWKETEQRTDFDLSALLLHADYSTDSWLSYTSLTAVGGEHSGDITAAPDGATEFINLSLDRVRSTFIVPQVNIYAGESFEEVEESFFGFMLRDGEQKGRPFEPRTVRMKSELRGAGRVALPLVFRREDDGRWRAKWLHLYLKGISSANRVEENQVSVSKRGARPRGARASDGAVPDRPDVRRHHDRGPVGRRDGPGRARDVHRSRTSRGAAPGLPGHHPRKSARLDPGLSASVTHGEAMKGLPSHSPSLETSPFAFLALDFDWEAPVRRLPVFVRPVSSGRCRTRPLRMPVVSDGQAPVHAMPFPIPPK